MRIRIIPILHVKGPNLVKGIHLEGLRVLGRPEIFAKRYYDDGADEILYLDTVASLYGRNNLHGIVAKTTEEVFIPVTVGGGVRSLDDTHSLAKCGCEKFAINTAATKRPELLTEIATGWGCQAVVSYVEARKRGDKWEALTDNGREETGRDAVEWVKEAVDRGAGEVLVTSVDREGTGQGMDLELIEKLSSLPVPIIANGGVGKPEHVAEAINAGADAIGIASMFHYAYLQAPQGDFAEGNLDFVRGKRGDVRYGNVQPQTIPELKKNLSERGITCRMTW